MYRTTRDVSNLDSCGESDTNQSPEKCSLDIFQYLLAKMADNSDEDSDVCQDIHEDSDLMEKIRQLEKEKEKLSRKNSERSRLEKHYKELSKSVKSLKNSSSISSGYGSSSPSPGSLDKNRLAESATSGLTSMLNEQQARLKNLTSNRSASNRNDHESPEESESDEDKDSKNCKWEILVKIHQINPT